MKKMLIIKTDEGEKALSLLNREQVSYQVVYNDDLDKGLTEEEIYRRDMRLANQDKEQQKEINFWDKIQKQDNAKLNNNDDEWDWN
jgi:hypothetical protein